MGDASDGNEAGAREIAPTPDVVEDVIAIIEKLEISVLQNKEGVAKKKKKTPKKKGNRTIPFEERNLEMHKRRKQYIIECVHKKYTLYDEVMDDLKIYSKDHEDIPNTGRNFQNRVVKFTNMTYDTDMTFSECIAFLEDERKKPAKKGE